MNPLAPILVTVKVPLVNFEIGGERVDPGLAQQRQEVAEVNEVMAQFKHDVSVGIIGLPVRSQVGA